jgi:hypothetical protein
LPVSFVHRVGKQRDVVGKVRVVEPRRRAAAWRDEENWIEGVASRRADVALERAFSDADVCLERAFLILA